MKTLSTLRTLINIYYYLLIIALIFGILSFPILLFTDKKYNLEVVGTKLDLSTMNHLKIGISNVLGYRSMVFIF